MNGEKSTTFFTRLLGRRKRRVAILYQWHMKRAPCHGDSLQQVLETFIHTLLHAPLEWCMTHEALYPWGMKHRGMAIAYEWLTPAERRVVCAIHANRDALFRKDTRTSPHVAHFVLSEYMHPIALSAQHRRELLRDFIGLCSAQPNVLLRAYVYRTLLGVAQHMVVSGKCVDPFLMPLIRFLYGYCEVDQMLVVVP